MNADTSKPAAIQRRAGLGIVLSGALWLSGAGCATDRAEQRAEQPPASRSDVRLASAGNDIRDAISAARDQVFPALVNIDVVAEISDGGRESKFRSTGSGTIISKEGHVLTNAHVTDEGERFWCVLSDKQRVPAKLIGEDPWTDLAVLQIDVSRLQNGPSDLHVADFADSNKLEVGDYVLAMGSPFSLSRTVTLGVVSNTERVFTSIADGGDVDEMMLNFEQRTGTFTNWIQHDALINPGNSGGPLVTLGGKVVGVNTRGGSGMAFATPSNLAQYVADRLIQNSEVERSTIGVTFRQLEGTGLTEGVLIDSVETEGPAARAGLKAGDVVLAMDGNPVRVRYAEEVPPLLKLIANKPVGEPLRVEYRAELGQGDTRTAEIETTRLLKDKGEEAGFRLWGVTVTEITERLRQRMRLPASTRGVMVTSVASGGTAGTADPSLQWGDIVTSIQGEPTPDLKAASGAYQKIAELDKKDRPEWVRVELEREGKSYITLVKPAPAETPDPPVETPRAWIGVATQPVNKTLAKQLGDEGRTGFRVTRVYSGTRAADAGLKVGDLITSLNGDRLNPRTQQDAGLFNREVRKLSIDGDATLGVFRDGREQDIKVNLERTKIESSEARRARNTDFDLSVRELTFFDRQDNRWPDDLAGVLVESVERAGWAGLGGVRPGDLIQRIGPYEITDVASFKKAMEEITKEQPSRVVFVVFRGYRTSFRFVEPDWKPLAEPADAQAEEAPPEMSAPRR